MHFMYLTFNISLFELFCKKHLILQTYEHANMHQMSQYKAPQPTEVGQYKNNSCTLKPKTEFSFN